MRRILLATAALALFGAGSAMAADSRDVEITAFNPEACVINNASTNLDLGTVVDVVVPGVFTYQCNFVGSPTLTFSSFNGGVVNGSDTADYGIFLNDSAISGTPSASWLKASDTSQSYGPSNPPSISTTSAANSAVSPNFAVALIEPLEIAGNYSDTLTISIAP